MQLGRASANQSVHLGVNPLPAGRKRDLAAAAGMKVEVNPVRGPRLLVHRL
jgi:hypothetical protein